jgi:hypothetical protein
MTNNNAEKNPEDWTTGGEPMTGPQDSYLHTLAHQAGVEVPDDLTKAEASEKVDELQNELAEGPTSRPTKGRPDPDRLRLNGSCRARTGQLAKSSTHSLSQWVQTQWRWLSLVVPGGQS